MTNVYQTEKREAHGYQWAIEWVFDPYMGAPWDEHDGHGPVTDWVHRDKRPGELVLAQDYGAKRYYDFQAAVKTAKADGWNTEPYNWPSKRAQAQAAALADYRRLRDWCDGHWHWCGVAVKLDGTDIKASLWGIESDAGDYFEEVIKDLMTECLHQRDRHTYPVNECGTVGMQFESETTEE